jgi:hypothetical protein
MVLFTLISQLPLVPLDSPKSLVVKNKVTLMSGTAIYLTLGGLIYSGKLPASIVAQLPDYKYLGILIVADLLLYVALHKFQFGIFPVFTLPPGDQAGGGYHEDEGEDKDIDSIRVRNKKSKKNKGDYHEDDLATTDEFDEISSVFRNNTPRTKTQEEPYPVPIEDDISDDDYQAEDQEPQEVSHADQDFFLKKDQKTVVENWDVEDFSNMEYVNA